MSGASSPDEVYAAAQQLLRQRHPQEAEALLRRLTLEFPAKLHYGESLLEALYRQSLEQAGRTPEVLDYLLEISARFDLTGDPEYRAIYLESVRATANPPVPLRRMLRFHELIKQLLSAPDAGGELAECGCFRGMSSHLMCSYLRRRDPDFDGTGYHIFDSFRGLSEPTQEDEIPPDFGDARVLEAMMHAGGFAASLESVRNSLRAFPRICYHPGWIPLTFRSLPDTRYRFVHVDVDLYDPTWDCLEYFYPRLMPGGVLVSDDYGWPGARRAIDEYCSQHGVRFTTSQYGQAILHGRTPATV